MLTTPEDAGRRGSRLPIPRPVALLVGLAVAALAASTLLAGETASSEIPLDDETHRLGIGESVRIESWTLRFLAVASDSRCPVGANCIVAGRAVVLLELISAEDPDTPHERSLDIPPGGGELVLDDGLRLRLDVEPAPRLDQPIEPSEYELLIEVAGDV